jgi:hypothetical protein
MASRPLPRSPSLCVLATAGNRLAASGQFLWDSNEPYSRRAVCVRRGWLMDGLWDCPAGGQGAGVRPVT